VRTFNTERQSDHIDVQDTVQAITDNHLFIFEHTDPAAGITVRDSAKSLPAQSQTATIHTRALRGDSSSRCIGDAVYIGGALCVRKVRCTDLLQGAATRPTPLRHRLPALADNMHGIPSPDANAAPESTIAAGRKKNTFPLRPSLEAFLHLERIKGN